MHRQKAGNAGGGLSDAEVAQMTREAPSHYLCRLSEKLIKDAVMFPCCGESASDGAARARIGAGDPQPPGGVRRVRPRPLLHRDSP